MGAGVSPAVAGRLARRHSLAIGRDARSLRAGRPRSYCIRRNRPQRFASKLNDECSAYLVVAGFERGAVAAFDAEAIDLSGVVPELVNFVTSVKNHISSVLSKLGSNTRHRSFDGARASRPQSAGVSPGDIL